MKRLIAQTLTLATALTLIVLSGAKVSGGQNEGTIPGTTAGKTFTAFLEALNSGDINKMKAFHREKGGSEENAEKDMGFYEQSGGLKVLSVSSSEEFEITVVAETRKDGMKVRFNMTVDSQAPHGIQGIRVQPAE